MSESNESPRGVLDEIQRDLIRAKDGNHNITGVIRWYWDRLGPILESRYVRIPDLANATGISVSTLRDSVHRVRNEPKRSSAPSARHSGNPGHRSRQGQARGTVARGPRPRGPEASASSPPTKVPDAEGWIPLENGSHYRRKPDNPNLFEIWRPGKQKPDMTSKHPDPHNQR